VKLQTMLKNENQEDEMLIQRFTI